ncbi:hypothetical protein HK405_012602, partial [Cladochytrium tenue]
MNADQVLNVVTLPLALALLAYVGRKCVASHSTFNLIGLACCLLIAAKAALKVVFSFVSWLPPWSIFSSVFLLRCSALALTYQLYERRLSVFFLSGAAAFIVTMRSLLTAYAAATVATVIVMGLFAVITPAGTYYVVGTPVFATKLVVYTLDGLIGAVIFFGTVVSLGRLLTHARAALAPLNASYKEDRTGPLSQRATLYRVILLSDATRFLFVVGVDVFLMATAADPGGRTGALPAGNLGFINLLETLRAAVLVLNLYVPSGIADLLGKDGETDTSGSCTNDVTSTSGTGNSGVWSNGAVLAWKRSSQIPPG